MPGGPTTVTSCGRRSWIAWRQTERTTSSSRARPTNGPSRAGRSEGSTSGRTASQASTGSAFPFASTGGSGLVLDGVAGRALRLPAHDEPARRRGRLQPGGGVDDVADRERLSGLGPTHRDERLARVHGRARGEPRPAPLEPVDGGEHPQPGADGALGVVAVGERRAEDRHHRVADELLEPPAVRLDLLAGSRVEAREGLADVLRVGLLGRRREALQVDEEDGDEPPLLPEGGGERRTAVGAEARLGVGAPAAPLADQLLTGLDPHVPSIVPRGGL